MICVFWRWYVNDVQFVLLPHDKFAGVVNRLAYWSTRRQLKTEGGLVSTLNLEKPKFYFSFVHNMPIIRYRNEHHSPNTLIKEWCYNES